MIKFLSTAPVKLLTFLCAIALIGSFIFVQFLLGPAFDFSKLQGGYTIAVLQLLFITGIVTPRLLALGARNAIIITVSIIAATGGVAAYIFLWEIPKNIALQEAATKQSQIQN